MLGVYVHVPFCATRCGYCDFTTYTAGELRGYARSAWAASAVAEVGLAARTLGPDAGPVGTVFFGGGTPTLLPPTDLLAVLGEIDARLGLAPGAEVTVEANPDAVDPASLAALRAGGVTRLSIGMQSARAHVLAALDRTHGLGRPTAAAREARVAGFEHVSLDLIFGAAGEQAEDWAASLTEAVAAGPDHVSVYGLTVEPGTRLAARVRRGEVPAPDEDVMADRYETADAVLAAAGLEWYEVSSFAAGPDARCRHNAGYWLGRDWWGIGPGAHSHVAGERWWNHRHPATWAAALDAGASPAAGRERLDAERRRLERVLLEVRMVEGLDRAALTDAGAREADRLTADGLLAPGAGPARLTLRGRLLADHVARELAA